MKRIIDIACVVLTVPLWGPLLLLLMLLVRWKLGSPIFFRQNRPGLHGQMFEMIKFRTMTSRKNIHGELLPDADRLTPFGKWLRSTSMDELPELLVVLRGDMSLVGPRPLLPQYLSRYNSEQARRHAVKPGLTGWAQVNGRNALSWEKKFEYDVWYVDHQSIGLDLKILALTFGQVFRKSGISAPDSVTMPEFMGTPPKGTSNDPR